MLQHPGLSLGGQCANLFAFALKHMMTYWSDEND